MFTPKANQAKLSGFNQISFPFISSSFMLNVLPILPIAALSQYLFGPLLFVLSLFMILLILVQRGKGGGLTGALGGPGGQSVFGSKAGDLFTRITVVVAAVWIFLLAFAVYWYNEDSLSSALGGIEDASTVNIGAGDADATPAAPTVGEANVGDLGSGEMMSETPDSATGTDATAPAAETPATATETPAADVPAATEMVDKPAETPPVTPTDAPSGIPPETPAPGSESVPTPEVPADSVPKTEAPEAPSSQTPSPPAPAPSEPAK